MQRRIFLSIRASHKGNSLDGSGGGGRPGRGLAAARAHV
ncbi:hypothetical protein BURPS1106B_2498 [Burkholderia pseudomallei 1106b]|nr:hypothetical protein BURPSS13_X0819 [Burkholderia pseudomallei S13]EES21517.1 hypothetical protein BURPS1106B_2498 [Burkholderia pseudomallei 1106b]